MKRLFNFLLCTIMFLIMGIICKSNYIYRNIIHYYLYEDSFNFNSIYSFYNKYLGGISFYDNDRERTKIVFDEQIKYKSIVNYYDGIKLSVENNYLVPSLKKGIVSFMGMKDKYGYVIIIKTDNNINIWYGNICNSNLKMYDYINKGEYIGESCSNYIYIVYEKEGKYLDGRKYFN